MKEKKEMGVGRTLRENKSLERAAQRAKASLGRVKKKKKGVRHATHGGRNRQLPRVGGIHKDVRRINGSSSDIIHPVTSSHSGPASVGCFFAAASSPSFHGPIDPDIPPITFFLRCAIIPALPCKLHWLPFDSSVSAAISENMAVIEGQPQAPPVELARGKESSLPCFLNSLFLSSSATHA